MFAAYKTIIVDEAQRIDDVGLKLKLITDHLNDKQLTDSYLYIDILMWQNIKKPKKLIKLQQSLALQVCCKVSYNELAKTIGLDNKTIEKHIQLLEKPFVIFRLRSFSRNLRKE